MTIEQRLSNLEASLKMAGLTSKEILTFDEASVFTGISKSYLYKLTCSKQIPHSKPNGKLVYFERKDLESWLRGNRISTSEEIAAKALKAINKKG